MSLAAQLKQLYDAINQSRGAAYSAGEFALLSTYIQVLIERGFSSSASALVFVVYDICEMFSLEVGFYEVS